MAVLYSGDEIVVGQMDTASLDLRNPNRRHSIIIIIIIIIIKERFNVAFSK